MKVLAKKAGLSITELEQRHSQGEKWCFACGLWKPVGDFSRDISRWDGLNPGCRDCRNKRAREAHVWSTKPKQTGRTFVPARDGDFKQARRRINFFVETGLLPPPNALPCLDCGHIWAACAPSATTTSRAPAISAAEVH